MPSRVKIGVVAMSLMVAAAPAFLRAASDPRDTSSPYGVLEYNPSWRQAEWNAAPIPADYAAYAAATVRHFKGRVKYWGIWNEPDSKTYWQPQDDMAAYSELLKMVYPVIKREDPAACLA